MAAIETLFRTYVEICVEMGEEMEETLLIVDDDRMMMRYCQRLLERAHFHVFTAQFPEDSLKILAVQKMDLLLTDMFMPMMDGFELITRARQVQPELPVLVMTGFGNADTAIQALHRGVDGLLIKPFENSAELINAVQRVLLQSNQRKDAARLQVLKPIVAISESLLAETSLERLEKLILKAMIEQFHGSCAGIYRLIGEQIETVCVTKVHSVDVQAQQAFIRKAIQKEVDAQLVSLGAANEDTPTQAALRAMGLEAALVGYVQRNEQRFVLCVGRMGTEHGLYSEVELEMFVILARQSGIALENARLYTELQNYVRQVQDSQRALVQAEKMAAVGRLVASLAHEINNPLQSVRNCLSLAARGDVNESERLRYIHLSDSELTRLVKTVQRMLAFYRAGSSESEEMDIGAIITRVLALLNSKLNSHGIQTNILVSGEPRLILGIADQMQQVFFNLILNAVDAIEEAQAEKQIWIEIEYTPDQVVFSVEDSGNGLPEQVRNHLFEPFTTTKKEGTGLGLTVTYGIIERHHGTITVQPPKHQRGACFQIALPN